jgi:hypothetical protein
MFDHRVSGALLINDHSVVTAEPYLAPPIGHTALSYRSGISHPGSIVRVAESGSIRVYRSVSYTLDPKWQVSPANFYTGAAKIESTTGSFPLVGNDFYFEAADIPLIRMNNGLVRISGSSGAMTLEFYDGTAWRAKNISLVQAGVGNIVGSWGSVTVLDNRPERVALRYLESGIFSGSSEWRNVDIALRRGSRFVEFAFTRMTANTIGVKLTTPAAMTATAERMVETAADGNGHKAVFVSSKSYTAGTANGEMTKGSSTAFDFMVGLEVSGAIAGDLAADLAKQYLGYISESVGVVRK